MFDQPSWVIRVAAAKAAGFVIGLLGLIFLPYFVPDAGWLIRWGILLWYTTVGAIIGMAGVFTWHPVLKLRMKWWWRDPMLGAWMNFVLTFFAYDQMSAMMVTMFGADGVMTSPFWFTAEGAVVGLVIGYVAKRVGGEGAEMLER